jgi:hypothetical protein
MPGPSKLFKTFQNRAGLPRAACALLYTLSSSRQYREEPALKSFFRNVSARDEPVKEIDHAASAVRRVEITVERETVTVIRPGATVLSDSELRCACCGQPIPAPQTICAAHPPDDSAPTLLHAANLTKENDEVK